MLIKYHKDATHDSVGTGFLLLHPIATTSNGMTTYRVLLITNKHVLPPEHGPKEMSVRIAVRSEIGEVEVKDVILPILGTDGKYLRSVAFHPNPGVDVAAIDYCGADLSRQHANLFREISETHRALTTDLLISDRDFEEASIGIGTQIYLLGYPSGMYDPRNTSPILRIGIISTEPNKDFSSNPELRAKYGLPSTIPGFLIDANVFPGSSGSIVLRRADIVPGFSSGGKVSVSYILGIVSMSIPIDDLWGTQRMGLGVVYDSRAIRETINLAISAH